MSEQGKLQGAEIIRPTGCKVGMHIFIYTTLNEWTRCSCRMFTYPEWQVALEEKA